MPGRLLELPGGDPLPHLAAYLRHAIETGHWVLLVTARVPGAHLVQRLAGLGVDTARVQVIDVCSPPGTVSGDPRVHIVAGPGLLELLTLRAEKMVLRPRDQRTRITTFDVNSFTRHNTPEALAMIVRHALARVQPYTFVDYLVAPDRPLAPDLLNRLEELCGPLAPLQTVLGVDP